MVAKYWFPATFFATSFSIYHPVIFGILIGFCIVSYARGNLQMPSVDLEHARIFHMVWTATKLMAVQLMGLNVLVLQVLAIQEGFRCTMASHCKSLLCYLFLYLLGIRLY